MKAFVLLLAVMFASHFVDVESRMTMAQITNSMKTVKKSCMTKTGVTKEVLDATRNDDFAEDKALMCFYNCAMGFMKTLKNGKFSREAVERVIDTMLPEDLVERARAVTEHCSKQVTSDDACEGCWQYAKCNWEMDKGVYFFP